MLKRLEVPPGRKAHDGPKRFKKGHHEVSRLSFNPIFILEFYVAGNQELIAMCLLFYSLSIFLLLSLSSLFSQSVNIEWIIRFCVQWVVFAVTSDVMQYYSLAEVS